MNKIFNKIIAACLSLCFVLPVFSGYSLTNAASYMMGDVTRDGKLTSDDATLVLIVFATKLTDSSKYYEFCEKIGDVTEDGRLTSEDATAILIKFAKNLVTNANENFGYYTGSFSAALSDKVNRYNAYIGKINEYRKRYPFRYYYGNKYRHYYRNGEEHYVHIDYYLTDINNDGKEELLIKFYDYDNPFLFLYKCENGQICYNGRIRYETYSAIDIYNYENNTYLLEDKEGGGGRYAYKLYLKSGKFYDEKVYSDPYYRENKFFKTIESSERLVEYDLDDLSRFSLY